MKKMRFLCKKPAPCASHDNGANKKGEFNEKRWFLIEMWSMGKVSKISNRKKKQKGMIQPKSVTASIESS